MAAVFEIEGVASLGKIRDKFGRFISGKWRQPMLANVAEEVIELVREGFERESDPYGAKWASLKTRSGRILQDTGGLRSSFHRNQLSATQDTVGAGKDYARYHQSGTSRMPARKMVPDGDIPGEWRSRINEIAALAIKHAFG